MQSPSRWLAHTPMTEPGALESRVRGLPADVASLNRAVQGLLVHCEWLAAYGANSSAFPSFSRATLPVSERLAALVERDVLGLDEARTPTQRSVGTCRDFALTLCSFLRTTGTPARLRCGFASYLADGWEDHWICEYWDNQKSEWLLSDPQLDEVTRAACRVTFNTSNMPRDVFLSAGEAWFQCRKGQSNPNGFGQRSAKGLWFLGVNVVRDSYAVNNRETSAWDGWREASPDLRTVHADELPALDEIARNPEQALSDLAPAWLRGAPTVSFIIPTAACNMPARTMPSGWRREGSQSA
jgi:hypothetical protein